MPALTLKPHPQTPGGAVLAIRARIRREHGVLALSYMIEGDIDGLRVPGTQAPPVTDRLWQHTCCEIFIARTGRSPYHEFNFSPSGEWAAYGFARYREGEPLAEAPRDPQVSVRRGERWLELEALIHLDRLSAAHACSALSLGLSAVIEDNKGALSYWALEHASGRPDFHHPSAFALELDEIRD